MSVKGLTKKSNYEKVEKAFSEPRVIDHTLQNKINKYMITLEHNKKLLEGKQSRVALVELRNKWKRQQDKLNYQSEYDRIRGLLESSVLKGTSTKHLEDRQKKLLNLDVGVRPSNMFDNLY